jgi:hypothetical protein
MVPMVLWELMGPMGPMGMAPMGLKETWEAME